MSLKREVADSKSTLRVWMGAQPMRLGDARRSFTDACRSHTPLLPDPRGKRVDWTLLGNGSGLGVVWHFDQTVPPATLDGAAYLGSTWLDRESGEVVTRPDWFAEFVAAWAAGPTGDALRDGAVATIAGVFERFTRRPYGIGEDPVHDVVHYSASLDEAVVGVPEWISLDVAALSKRGASALGSIVRPLTVGPTFSGSSVVGGADADFIADGVLWDVKALTKAELRTRDLHQVIGYALLDFDDEHRISKVGICSSRYGVAQSWDVEWLIGRNLKEARAEVRSVLGAANP
jgi:hypothetical protein